MSKTKYSLDEINSDEQLLEKIKNVDGPASGLDADKLDGLDSSQLLNVLRLPNNSNAVTWNKIGELRGLSAVSGAELNFTIVNANDYGKTTRTTFFVSCVQRGDNIINIEVYSLGTVDIYSVQIGYVQLDTYDFDIYIKRDAYNPCLVYGQSSTFNGYFADYLQTTTEPSGISYVSDAKVWTSGNDGSGSGLDADTVDGVQGALLGIGGDGYAWVDETANRAVGTTYTNTTGHPIMVSIKTETGESMIYTVDGIDIAGSYDSNGINVPVSFIVPNNSTYLVSGGSILIWTELK